MVAVAQDKEEAKSCGPGRGSPQGWGSTGEMPSGPEGETWLCLAKAFVARVLFSFSRCSREPESLKHFLWGFYGTVVVAP